MRKILLSVLSVSTFILLLIPGIKAQEKSSVILDSNQRESISLVDISSLSYQSILKARQIKSNLIVNEKLMQLKLVNDSLVSSLNLMLTADETESYSEFRKRKLEEKILLWKRKQIIIESQITEITDVLHNLEDNRIIMNRELFKWNKTDIKLRQDELYESVKKKISEVLITIEDVLDSINGRRELVLDMMDKSMSIELKIGERIAEIRKILKGQQLTLFSSNNPSLIHIDYFDINNWKPSEPFDEFYKTEFRNLKIYLYEHQINVLLHLLLIAALIFLFRAIKKRGIEIKEKEEGSVYKQRFKWILSRPISIALIIGLSLSGTFYPNMPMIWDDILVFLAIIPLIRVLSSIISRNFHIYIYLFGIIVLLQLAYVNMPDYNLISRLILLLIGVIEALALLRLLRLSRGLLIKKSKFILLFQIILTVQFSKAILGIGGIFVGKIFLAEFCEFSIIDNVFTATLIVLVLVVLNGLTVIFIQSKFTNQINSIKANSVSLIRKATNLFNFLAILLLIYFMLKILGLDSDIRDGIIEWLGRERNFFSTEFSWGTILAFIVVIWFSVIISGIIKTILEKDVLNKVGFGKGLSYTISLMVKYTIVTIGVFLAASAAGLPFSQLTIIFGALGVGIGFGLQSIINNLVSGLILLFERPLKIDDIIEVGTLMGHVKSIGIRASRVRTFDGAEIIVPNGNLVSNEVINWTLSDKKRRIEVIVGVSYNSDPHQVHEILMNTLVNHKDVVEVPNPTVYFRDFGESSIDFRMLFWTKNYDDWLRIKSEILFNVFDQLKQAGIEIPFPQRDVHVRSSE